MQSLTVIMKHNPDQTTKNADQTPYNPDQTSRNADQTIIQTGQNQPSGLKEKEIQLLDFLEKEASATQAEMAKVLGWKVSLVKYYVESLKKKGLLERAGTSHKGYWKVKRL